MTTQTFRGIKDSGSMHWRGDRSGGEDEANAQPNSGAYNEDLSFKKFNPAFVGLLGNDTALSLEDMQKFTDFSLALTPPPNPIRQLDNSLTSMQSAGETFYFNTIVDTQTCNTCHVLDSGQKFFGTDGRASFEGETQHLKIPHLRNLYTKVGMFGNPNVSFFNAIDNTHTGDQIRGFGFLHDGSADTLFRFFNATLFFGFTSDTQRKQMEQFMFAFESNLKPVVGQQVTRTSTNATIVNPRIDLLIARAQAGDNDLVVKGVMGGVQRGWYRLPNGDFVSDKGAEAPISEAALRMLANTPGQNLTFTAVPPGSGARIGIDRDEDLILDGDDNCPANAIPDQLDTDGDDMGDVCDIDDDNDGLSDEIEATLGTNPLLVDTDGDGFNDGLEVAENSDPLNNQVTPANGDVNSDGVVNLADLLNVIRISIGEKTPTETELLHSDVGPQIAGIPVPDGKINAADVLLVQLKILGFKNF